MRVASSGVTAFFIAAGFLIAPPSGATEVFATPPKIAVSPINVNTARSTQVYTCKELVSKPRNLNLTCDGPPTFVINGEKYPGSGGKLSNIKWNSWGAKLAKGTGTLALSTKDETTKQTSVYKRMKVSITLSKPKTQQGEMVFTQAVTTQGPGSEINTWQLKKVS